MFKINQRENGSSAIILTVLVLAVILVIGFGLANLTINQIKMSRQSVRSDLAYFAADAGMERGLYEVRKGTGPIFDNPGVVTTETLGNGAVYEVIWDGANIISSLGKFQGANRKIRASW